MNIESEVKSLYKKWFKRFQKEWEQPGRYSPSFLPSTDEDLEYLKQDQIEFIGIYLGHMLIDGDSKENLLRIKHFLKMQKAIHTGTDLEIRFLQGNPYEVFVFVYDIDEIDIADVYGICEFKKIYVYRRDGRNWTEKMAEQFVNDVRADLRFDGLIAELQYSYKEHFLEIECKIR